MRKLGFLTLIPLSAGVIGLTVGALWLVGSSSGQRERFSSLEIAPADPVFYMAINTEPSSSQWIAVSDVLGTLNAKEPLRDAIDEELLKFGLEFERDILPLASDEGYVAVTDVEAASNNTGGLVVAFRLRDAGRAEQIALDVADQEGTEFTEEEYEGVTIRQSENLSQGDPGAIAFIDDVMVVGTSLEDVEGVIDVVQGRAPNAGTDERLRELRERQEEDFLVWGYADMAPIWDKAESSIPTDLGVNGSSDPIETPPPELPPEPQTGFHVLVFDADYRIENGALLVTEKITADFGETPSQGLTRDVATRVTYDYLYDVIVTIEPRSVTRDGIPEPFVDSLTGGDYHRITMGDPAATVSGQHTYELQYVVMGALINVEDEEGTFYDIVWNVTGNNWGAPIEQASATLTIPDGMTFGWTPCAVGEDPVPAIQEGCSMTQDGITTMRFASYGPIGPGYSMAFMANVSGDSGAPDAELVPNHRLPFESDQPTAPFPFAFDYPQIFDELRGTYDRVAFSVGSTGDGFTLDATVLHAPGFEPKYAAVPAKAFESHFADRLPADTMFFLAGNDFYREGYLSGQDEFLDTPGPDGQTIKEIIDGIEQELGIDLQADLLALMTGEVAIAGNVSDFSTGGFPEFELLALAEVNDAAKMENTMRKLGDFLERKELGTVEDSEREGVQRWSAAQAPDSAAWTVDGGDVILGYPESAVAEFLDSEGESLADTADWKRTMEILPDQRTSVGYISLARLIQEARQIEGAEADFEQSTEGKLTFDDLAPIRALGFATTTMDDGYGARVVVLIAD